MPRKILIVDDARMVRALVRHTLEEERFEVHDAENALIALSMLKRARYDLIISDLNMPGMTGLEFASKIKDENLNGDAAFFMLTSESSEKHRASARRLGIHGWLRKPFQPSTLKHLVSEGLLKTATRRPAAA